MRNTTFAAVLFLPLLLLVPACSGQSSGEAPRSAPDAAVASASQAEPVPIIPNKRGTSPAVQVHVGNYDHFTVPVTLDTGSTGLRIFNLDNTVDGVDINKDVPLKQVYGDGTIFDGYQGTSLVSLGGVAEDGESTTQEIPIHVVTEASCTPDASAACRGSMQNIRKAEGTYGILGIGLDKQKGGLVNPLRYIDGFDHHYTLGMSQAQASVTIESGVISPGKPDTSPEVTWGLSPAQPSANNQNFWESYVPACWKYENRETQYMSGIDCMATLLDTGTEGVDMSSSISNAPPVGPVDPQEVVLIMYDGPGGEQEVWDYASGPDIMDSLTVTEETNPLVLVGGLFFFLHQVTYDLEHGHISVRPPLVPHSSPQIK